MQFCFSNAAPSAKIKARPRLPGIGLRKMLAVATILTCGAAPLQAAPLFALGAYVLDPNGSDATKQALFEQNEAAFTTAMGTPATLLDVYLDQYQTVNNWPSGASWEAWSCAQSSVAKRMTPVLGFPMASLASGSMPFDQQLQAFTSGQYDWVIQNTLRAWNDQGFKNVIVRVGWEMNIDSVAFVGSDPKVQADWVAAFRHIVMILRQEAGWAGTTVQVVWNPGVTNYSKAQATTSLYPGDDVVDIIAADMYGGMYPFSDGSGTQFHDWATGGEDTSEAEFIAKPANRMHYWSFPAATRWSNDGSGGHSQTLNSLIVFARQHNKPFGIAEVGAGNADSTADVADESAYPIWLGRVLKRAVAEGSKLAFVIIWDANAQGSYEYSYDSDNKPNERTAWREAIGSLAAGN